MNVVVSVGNALNRSGATPHNRGTTAPARGPINLVTPELPMRLSTLPFLFVLALACGPSWSQEAPVATAAKDTQAADAALVESEGSAVPLDEIRRYVTVFNAIRHAYVEPVDDHDLMQAAIRGLLLDLDPHSAYLDHDRTEQLDEATSGAYDGIGVEVMRQSDNSLLVIAPIDDTPAARAGVQAGDVIIAVDGETLRANDETAAPLRGEAGSEVVLTIERKGRDKPFDIAVVRDTISLDSVRGRMLEPGYGYIRISTFQADTGADFARVLDRLKQEADGKLRGLVLDLRSNPGGLLTTAVQVADELLDSGAIVSTRGRIAISDTTFSATPGDRLDGAPLVVLVDAGSASASEVVAGALRDHKRARIVGSRTFGKGSVQAVLPLDNGDSIKLTTARYYTPSGESIQAIGIKPDVVLHAASDSDGDNGYADYNEASLPGHLIGEQEPARAGTNAGEVLAGQAPIDAALVELKRLVAPETAAPDAG